MDFLSIITINFLGKEAVFSLAVVVGKPLQVDVATQNKTRPSCASVKAKVDLLGEFPKRINVGMRMKSREVKEKWVTIRYDYVPKNCKTCKLRGHNAKECFIIHPELYPKEEEEENKENKEDDKKKGNLAGEKKEGNDTTKEDKGKTKQGENTEFQEQKRKKGSRKGRQNHRGRMEMRWNLRP